MYLGWSLIKTSAPREWARGLPRSYDCMFLFVLLFCSYARLFWTSSQTSSTVCYVTNLVTRLTNASMAVKSKDERTWETWKWTRGLGPKRQFGICRLLTPVFTSFLCRMTLKHTSEFTKYCMLWTTILWLDCRTPEWQTRAKNAKYSKHESKLEQSFKRIRHKA